MNLQSQRFIDRWLGQILCALLSVWAFIWRRAKLHPVSVSREPKNILVIMLSEMGSIVLAGPMFESIRLKFPGAKLHMLQLKKNQEISKLLKITDTECLHTLDDASFLPLLRDIIQLCWNLRKMEIDAVIDCELFSRISSLIAYITGANYRAGFTPHTMEGLYRGSYINCAIPYNPYKHISLQFMSLVDALECAVKNLNQPIRTLPIHKNAPIREIPNFSGFDVVFSELEIDEYKHKLLTDHPQFRKRKIVLIYASGGLLPERAWPASHFIRLANEICRAGHAVGLIGLKEDRHLVQGIQNQINNDKCIDLTGYTHNIKELLMLFHCSHHLITNDGGPGHFASLTPIPFSVFFGPETSQLYGPLPGSQGFKPIIFESKIACSPCLSAYNHRQTFCDGDVELHPNLTQDLHRILTHPI